MTANGWKFICTNCQKLCACVAFRVSERRATWWVHRSSCCRASVVPAYEEEP